jgi:hypothetical protein
VPSGIAGSPLAVYSNRAVTKIHSIERRLLSLISWRSGPCSFHRDGVESPLCLPAEEVGVIASGHCAPPINGHLPFRTGPSTGYISYRRFYTGNKGNPVVNQIMRSTQESNVRPAPSLPSSELHFGPDDTMSIAEMARWLCSDDTPEKGIQWVREKCRPRSPNPIPFKNLGRNLVFSRIEVSDWIRNTQHTVHARHRRRTTLHVMKKAA